MSNFALEDFRSLLKFVDDEVTAQDLVEHGKNLFTNLEELDVETVLQSLQELEIVDSTSPDRWYLTQYGREESLPVMIADLDSGSAQEKLDRHGLEVSNLVATFDLNQTVDLEMLARSIHTSEYEPEHSPFLLHRPVNNSNITVLVPANGVISIVGARSKEELIQATDQWLMDLADVGIEISESPQKVQIRNIVIRGDFDREFDLEMLAIGLGLERTEYDPENFPGLIYRTPSEATILVFRSGKFVIAGVTTYSQAVLAMQILVEDLARLDIPLDESIISTDIEDE